MCACKTEERERDVFREPLQPCVVFETNLNVLISHSEDAISLCCWKSHLPDIVVRTDENGCQGGIVWPPLSHRHL